MARDLDFILSTRGSFEGTAQSAVAELLLCIRHAQGASTNLYRVKWPETNAHVPIRAGAAAETPLLSAEYSATANSWKVLELRTIQLI